MRKASRRFVNRSGMSILTVLLGSVIGMLTITAISKLFLSAKASIKKTAKPLDEKILQRKIVSVFSGNAVCQDSLRVDGGFPLVTASLPINIGKVLAGGATANPKVVFDQSSLSNETMRIGFVQIAALANEGTIVDAGVTKTIYRATLNFGLTDLASNTTSVFAFDTRWLVSASDEMRECTSGAGLTGEFSDFVMEMGGSFYGMSREGGDVLENHKPTPAERAANPTKKYWWCGEAGTWGMPQGMPADQSCQGAVSAFPGPTHLDRVITNDLSYQFCFLAGVELDPDGDTWSSLDAHKYYIEKQADGFHMIWQGHAVNYWTFNNTIGKWVNNSSAFEWYPVMTANFTVRCVK